VPVDIWLPPSVATIFRQPIRTIKCRSMTERLVIGTIKRRPAVPPTIRQPVC
jgi:hypothetical protein